MLTFLNRLSRNLPTLATAAVLAVAPAVAAPQTPAADNTKMNKRDRDKSQPTADQAKNTKSDLEIMKEIRQSVVGDKALSTYAHNVKIISKHGKVTLKGPVHTAEEKSSIESKATEVAGAGNVTNQISIKASKK